MGQRKRGFEFSFAWLFAILVGALILFLAIYASVKFIRTGTYQIETVTAKQLSIIFEPMEVGLAEGKKPAAVTLREETRIYNSCFIEGSFGKHKISLSAKGFGGKWQEPGGEISITNKYVFSSDIEQGKKVYFFSKPFKMPWKVSEIIFLTTSKYCFVNAPEEIVDEVLGLGIENIKIDNCTNEIKVCFDSTGCEIKVSGECLNYDCESEYDYGFVSKDGKQLFYTGSLLYAAIFSSKEIYDCNVKRLMKRLTQESLLYKDEADFLTGKCGINSAGFVQVANLARNLDNSGNLLLVYNAANELEKQNEASECQLW